MLTVPYPELPRRDNMVALYLILLARKQTQNPALGQSVYNDIADHALDECKVALGDGEIVFSEDQNSVLEMLKMSLSVDE